MAGQVGNVITRIISTFEGGGFNQFDAALLRSVKAGESARHQMTALGNSILSLQASANPVVRSLGGILDVLQRFSQPINSIINNFGTLIGVARTVGSVITQSFSVVAGVINTAFVGPLVRASQGLLNLLNPLNLIESAMNAIANVATIAFGVALGNALTELARKANEFVNALSPLQTGQFAGEIGTQLKALAVTAANAGLSFDQVKGSVNGVRILGIQASEAIKSISQGFQVGLNPSQIQQLARAAQDMAVVIGSDSSEAFNRLFNAIVSGNSELLRFAGIMKTQDQIIQDFSRTSGKSVQEIRGNVNLLRQAFFQGIIEEARQFAGAYEASLEELGKRLSSFPRTFNDLRLGIGRLFEPFLAGAFTVVEEVTESLSQLFFVTKRGALENAAAQINTSENIKLTGKDLALLQTATIKGGEAMEEAFVKVAASSGASVAQLKSLADQGAFTSDAIAKIGKAFEPTELGNQLRGLSYAIGSIVQGLAKGFFALINGGQQAIQTAVPQMVSDGIQFVANFALGILTGITQFVIPAAINIITAITQVLAGGTVTMVGSGLTLISSLASGLISGVAASLTALGGVIGNIFTNILGGLANSLTFLGDVKNWGKAIPGAAEEGVEEGTFSLTQALKDIYEAAMRTVPDSAPTDVIGNWGKGVIRAVLDSLQLRDFSALNFLQGIIQSFFGQGSEEQAVTASNAVAQALADLNTQGSISATTLAALGASFGAAFGDVQKYLQAINEMNIGLDRQEQLEQEVEDAVDNVQAAQERLRQFETDSAGIPERYTRGRRAQLQAELDAAQKEQEAKRDALRDQQKANENIRESVDLQRALISEMVRAAEIQAKIASDAANQRVDVEDVPVQDIDAQLKRIGNEFRAQIISAFDPVREQFTILGNIIRGFLGLDAVLPKPPDKADYADTGDYEKAMTQYREQVAEQNRAVAKGLDLRSVLTNLATVVVPQIQSAFEKVKEVVSDIYDFMLLLVAAAQGFVAALTGNAPPQSGAQDSSQGGQRDPKATESAAGIAGFAAGQDFITISQQTIAGLNTLGNIIGQLQAFAAAHPNGVKFIGEFALLNFLSGGALLTALIAQLPAVIPAFFSILGALFQAGALVVDVGAIIGGKILAGLGVVLNSPAALIAIVGAFAGALIYQLTTFFTGAPGIDEMGRQLGVIIKEKGLAGLGLVAQEFGKGVLDLLLGAVKRNIFVAVEIPGLILEKITEIFGGPQAAASVKTATENIANAILSPFQWVYDQLVGNSIIPDLVDAIVLIMGGAAALLTEPMNNVANAILGPIQSAADQAKALIASLTGQGNDNEASGTAKNELNPVQGGNKSNTIGDTADDTVDAVGKVDAALASSQAASITDNTIVTPIKEKFTGMKDKVAADTEEMSGKVTASVSDMANRVKGPAQTTANNISTPIETLVPKIRSSIATVATDLGTKIDEMLLDTGKLKQGFIDLGNEAAKAMTKVATSASSNLAAIKTSLREMTKQVVGMVTDIQEAFDELGKGPVLAAIQQMMTTMIRLFRELFDELVGHSIVPDLVDGIVGEFQDLNPRTQSPLEKFTEGVENTVGAIDGKMNLGLKGMGNGGGRSGGAVEVKVDQRGWVFPATMDVAQMEQLRRIAREETYTGIQLAFDAATKAGSN